MPARKPRRTTPHAVSVLLFGGNRRPCLCHQCPQWDWEERVGRGHLLSPHQLLAEEGSLSLPFLLPLPFFTHLTSLKPPKTRRCLQLRSLQLEKLLPNPSLVSLFLDSSWRTSNLIHYLLWLVCFVFKIDEAWEAPFCWKITPERIFNWTIHPTH